LIKMSKKGIISASSVSTPSPFRYPGGKSWLVPYVKQWLAGLPSEGIQFIEPFAGGANVGLSVAIESLAEHVTLVEMDKDVAAVWEVVLNGRAKSLTNRIMRFKVTKESVTALLKKRPRTPIARAFSAIVKNRTRRGGIMASDASLLKLGENGNGLNSRWYPETLKKRIEVIAEHSAKISFQCGDGLECIRNNKDNEQVAFFIDPPYTIAGRRLYKHSSIDQRKLFELLETVQGKILMTYDNTAEIRALVREFGFQYRHATMRTTHHSTKKELLVSRDFAWLKRTALRRPTAKKKAP